MKNVLNKLVVTINEYRDVCRKAAEANIKFAEAFAPRLTDMSLIEKIHQMYVTFARESGFSADGTDNNKQFLFLILWLYSPASLMGGKINKHLRRVIASALGINADTALYKMRSTSVSWYETYQEFRRECNLTLEHIEKHMSELTGEN